MGSSRWRLLRRDLVGRVFHPRFQEIVRETGGLMRAVKYRRLFDIARAAEDHDVVEVGTGGGGSTIALALGLLESGKTSRVVTVERCEGGSRTKLGGFEDNLEILRSNFRRFGVVERIRVCPIELTEDNSGQVFALVDSPRLAGLVHDADGRIDRDFSIFWPRLVEGGFIVIDDCSDRADFHPRTFEDPTGGTKRLVTYRLLKRFVDWGLFRQTGKVGGTLFGVKPPGADFGRFDREVCADILREIEDERRAHCEKHGLGE